MKQKCVVSPRCPAKLARLEGERWTANKTRRRNNPLILAVIFLVKISSDFQGNVSHFLDHLVESVHVVVVVKWGPPPSSGPDMTRARDGFYAESIAIPSMLLGDTVRELLAMLVKKIFYLDF